QAQGGQVTINHRLAARRVLTGSVEISWARTIASPVLFCSAFQICIPEELDRLTLPRFRNTLGLNYVDDHTDNALNPARGYLLRSGFAWATPWLSSSVVFTRFTTEGAWYRTLRPGWVFATSLRLGNFFQTVSTDPGRSATDFLPPEERFYAGGATTVRGYGRNELGPLVYVTDKVITDSITGQIRPASEPPTRVPLGGTSFGVANAEVRFPSPLFRRQMRLAAFIDAGAIRSGNIWEMVGTDWRFTPGVGLRIATPVGPARIDAAYNPYNPVAGVLFVADSARIAPVRTDYAPPAPNFFGRWRVHVAIGQAF
ncbi:MAG TPA: BamA/TamA family outer membrane protein, partial [Longimicrobiales bacterium]